ncbi:nucleotidyltransferase domain-containing protein [Burkholderia sp. Ac-20365]|uniref:nucleotidyltransferase domain-containing protein n=1 Tax=Burkholderia sp. Ac-20365 TaxID=2703897 RepID=UPI00197BA57B|nr:nucleotidyltransferase domain-containing protein [Burkholderia sp. Ac-20365]MBN3759861.1 nucleotidyltransferase domain-containing protein [Burkholderia sp. Ac-20365]
MKSENMTKVRYTHPVDPTVRKRVMEELDHVERTFGVKVLYACESGSRGWGFASPDSDYDVRFLYVHARDWYLKVEPQRDVIERPLDDVLDVSGWELRKALQLLHRSNPTLLEWLDSPVVYREDGHWTPRLRGLADAFFSPMRGRHHYLSMAKKNFRGYLQDETVRYKKYLYVLRPLLAVRWIDAGLGMPPMRFADLVAGTVHDSALLAEVDELLELKMKANESEYGPRRPAIHAFVQAMLDDAAHDREYKRPYGDVGMLDAFLWDVLTHDA